MKTIIRVIITKLIRIPIKTNLIKIIKTLMIKIFIKIIFV